MGARATRRVGILEAAGVARDTVIVGPDQDSEGCEIRRRWIFVVCWCCCPKWRQELWDGTRRRDIRYEIQDEMKRWEVGICDALARIGWRGSEVREKRARERRGPEREGRIHIYG